MSETKLKKVCRGGDHSKTVLLMGDHVRQGASSHCGAADVFTLRKGQYMMIPINVLSHAHTHIYMFVII